MKRLEQVLWSWLPLAVVMTGLVLFGYAAVQQSLRQGGYDPQIQLAQDTAVLVAAGRDPAALVGMPRVQLDQSLAPAIIIFNENQDVLASSAELNRITPKPPTGTFAAARQTGEVHFTWEPAPNVRQAMVLRHVSGGSGGFVLATRSLKEVEARTERVAFMALTTLLLGLFITLGVVWLGAIRADYGRRR